MAKFFSVSGLRQSLEAYLKYDVYSTCRTDLCSFFRDKGIGSIFNNPILLAPGNHFRYIKSRIANSNLNTGKSGCYRLYYYVDLLKEHVYLLGYYPKTGKHGRSDLSHTEEKAMIRQFKEKKKANALIEHDIDQGFKAVTDNGERKTKR